MREVKYQAWEKKERVMFQVARFDFADYSVYRHLFGEGIPAEQCDLREFTGMYDKNGKEIYEGDVLYDDLFEEYGLVVFEEGGFRVNWETITDDLFENCDVLEIAGNLYEDPELLEGAEE